MMHEMPVAWRVWWFFPSDKPFDPMYKAERVFEDFATIGEAGARKQAVYASLGERSAVCVEPRYVSRTKREAKLKASQDSLADAGWPIQKRPVREP